MGCFEDELMSKLRNYRIYILRKNNDFDLVKIVAKKPGEKKLSGFKHRGHRYCFDPEYSYIIHEVTNALYWILPDCLQKHDRIMLFREPPDYEGWDYEKGEETPIMPLTVPVAKNTVEESPLILKGVTRSQLLHRYRMKQKFGKTAIPSPWVLLLIGVVIIVALLILTNKIMIPGVNAPG